MNLLMLTKFYPYGTGEAFIENEIPVMSRYFEKILIIACEVSNKMMKIRKVPPNVSVIKIEAPEKKKILFQGVLDTFVAKKLEDRNAKTLLDRMFLYYFDNKSKYIYEKVINETEFQRFIKEPYILYSYWLFTTAKIGIDISKLKKPEYLFSRGHGYDIYEYRNKLNYLPYRNLLLENYDKILCCSNDGKKYLQNKYQKYKNKIDVSFLGTLDYGIEEEVNITNFRIVSCSRIVPLKRVNRILETLKKIDKLGIVLEWHHFGDGKEINSFKKKASKLKNIKCTFFGDIPNKELMNIYASNYYNLFINVSETEGIPVSIMEAVSFGIPIIATDVGGTKEIVKNNEVGVLLKKDFSDNELLNSILKFYYMENNEYQLYRQNCREYWKLNFEAENNYSNLYLNILEKWRK